MAHDWHAVEGMVAVEFAVVVVAFVLHVSRCMLRLAAAFMHDAHRCA